MPSKKLVLGTRGSALALWQARHVLRRLRALEPDWDVQMRTLKTRGDRVRDRALSQVGGKGLFVKEIESALLAGEIDLAVHSLKDMPTELPAGLGLGVILKRADPRDALIVHTGGLTLAELQRGARVGTSSLRRQAQLLAVRPDLRIVPLRGNVDTRLRKLREGACDAIILAVAGLERLGHAAAISQYLPVEVMLPAAGQGALCVEARVVDKALWEGIGQLDDPPTRQATEAERAFLAHIGSGCHMPVGAYAQMDDGTLWLRGLIALPNGTHLMRCEIRGAASEAGQLGVALAERMLADGGQTILEEMRLAR